MSIIKEKIRFTGNDLNLQIPIGNSQEFTGYQQEIDNYTVVRTATAINETADAEVRRFKLDYHPIIKKIYFAFHIKGSNPTAWNDNFTYAGFTTSEIQELNANYLNSFFIMDFFDTYDPKTQIKIFSAYLTNLSSNNVFNNPTFSGYEFDEDFQYYYQYIPTGLLDIEEGSRYYTGYTRFSFYNAKSGTTVVFYNRDNEQKTSGEKMFVKTILDFNEMSFRFDTPSNTGSNPYVYLNELVSSPEYIEKYNDTFENFDNLQQTFPAGNTFNYQTGKYNIDGDTTTESVGSGGSGGGSGGSGGGSSPTTTTTTTIYIPGSGGFHPPLEPGGDEEGW